MQKEQRTIGILFFGNTFQNNGSNPRSISSKFRRVNEYGINARGKEYMVSLAKQVLGESTIIIEAGKGFALNQELQGVRVVLLWPDAIGMGWSAIEREVWRRKAEDTEVWVLNGRRRHFKISFPMLYQFRLRRIVERLWLGELMFGIVLISAAPILAVCDRIRGRV